MLDYLHEAPPDFVDDLPEVTPPDFVEYLPEVAPPDFVYDL